MILNAIKSANEIDSSTLNYLIENLSSLIYDAHFKVAIQAIKYLTEILKINPSKIEHMIERLIHKLVIYKSEKKEELSKASHYALESIIHSYSSDILLPYFLKCIEGKNAVNSKACALDYIPYLIRE